VLSKKRNSRRKNGASQHYPMRFENRMAVVLIDELLIDVAGATQVLYETRRFQFNEPAMIFSLKGG
jgi:hypothetical protein